MKRETFAEGLRLLKLRFGEKAFDPGFVELISREVRDMSDYGFTRAVEHMLGARPHNKPPLLPDFRDMRLKEQKSSFDRDVQGASAAMDRQNWNKGLSAFLAKEYPGCKTLNQAVEVCKFRREIERADGKDPDAEVGR